jgi:16S rRNA (cytosine1402-N4)-methyltransferase
MPQDNYHVPVLATEVINYLVTDRNGTYIDATLGGGGHARKILAALGDTGRLIGIDCDREAIAHNQDLAGERVRLAQGNFKDIDMLLNGFKIEAVQGILLDLGVSSRQLDEPARGFSYRQTQPMDMRMDQTLTRTAGNVLNTYTESQLADVFFHYGEITWSRKLARAVVQARPLADSADLVRTVETVVRRALMNKIMARVFQALRIEVNQELTALRDCLGKSLPLLATGGRLVVISYHSLEDRIVKHFFKGQARLSPALPEVMLPNSAVQPDFRVLTPKPVMAGREECKENPRARSAKLRAAERNA